MRRAFSEFEQHLASEVTTLATCYRITKADGVELGFTDHDESLLIDSLEYDSIAGFTPTTIESKSDMSVDNMEIEGFSFSSKITEADLLAGIYDYAEVEIFLVNYEDLDCGKMILKRGKLGEVTLNKQMFRAEIRGLTQHLSQTIGTIYSPTCNAILGDSRCTVNLATCTAKAEVTQVINKQSFIAKKLKQTAGYFTGGEVKWLSGDNLDARMEVKKSANCSGGVDCIGLVVGICDELGICDANGCLLSKYDRTGYSMQTEGDKLVQSMQQHLQLVEHDQMTIGDILLFRFWKEPQHIGVLSNYLTGGFGLIHCNATSASVIEQPLSDTWIRMITHVYRFKRISLFKKC